MSMQIDRQQPWTEEEKIFLLTEIIRVSKPPRPSSADLFAFVNAHRIVPTSEQWESMPLPFNRSLHACKVAFEDLRSQQRAQHASNILPFGAVQAQFEPLPPERRPFPPIRSVRPATPRPLQPRPPSVMEPPNGDGLIISQMSPSDIIDRTQKKKRGRPSKKEIEARVAEAQARGEIYQPPKPSAPRKPKKSALSTGAVGPADIPSFVTEADASPDPLQTPQPVATEKSGDSSSGKKRKRPRTKSDTPNSPVTKIKRWSPRQSKNPSHEQSPSTGAGRSFLPALQTTTETPFPRGSIEGLLSGNDEPAIVPPIPNEVQELAGDEGAARGVTESSQPIDQNQPQP